MSQKKMGYTPGDVASFLAKQSTGTASIKEQSQLRALFDKPVTVKQLEKKNDTAAAVGSLVKTLKEGRTVPSTSGPKPKKRSASDAEENRPCKPDRLSKRMKNDPETIPESSKPNKFNQVEQTAKGDELKLSPNELNAKRRLDAKLKKKISKEEEVKNKRTVFIGNVALTVSKKALMKLFKPFGKVEAVRIRSVPVAAQKKPKKALVIRKEFDPERHSMNAYIVFATEEEAQQSLQLNGTELEGLHMRVDLASITKKHDHKSSIFVGNMPFNVEEETVRKHFDVCGEIENVRIIRDKFDGSGKGFGYVKFADQTSVNLALKMDGQELLGRALRVKKAAKKPKKKKIQTEDEKTKHKGKQMKAKLHMKKPRMVNTKPAGKVEQAKKDRVANESEKAPKKPRKPLRKFGDLKNRLKSMNSSSVGSRKEKHGIKKALREMALERKKLSLGKLLTGGKRN